MKQKKYFLLLIIIQLVGQFLAQKFKNGHLNNYTATFASIFPADNPEFVMVISIDEPEYGKHWANLSAVPSSREIIKRMLIKDDKVHENIAKRIITNKESDNNGHNSSILSNNTRVNKNIFPSLIGKTWKEALKTVQEDNITLIPDNMMVSGTIVNQSIKPGSKIKKNMVCQVKIKI